MAKHFGDRLCDAVIAKKSPLIVGIDPVYSRLPEEVRKRYGSNNDIEAVIDATIEFCTKTLKIVAPYVPAVKFNIAYFERYFWEGIEAYYSLIAEADSLGLEVIGDVKRGDIGHTCTAYADAHLKDPKYKSLNIIAPDAITVNGFAGADGILPFADAASECNNGIFVWIRASNPSAARLQDATTKEGMPFYQILAEITNEIASQPRRIGENGYSNIGMVVGGTTADNTAAMRARYPNVWFLVPGFGSQGGSAEDCVKFCKPDGTGALINSSRAIIYAYEDEKYTSQFGSDWEKCIEQATIDSCAQLKNAMQK